jgi:hypothetical protein
METDIYMDNLHPKPITFIMFVNIVHLDFKSSYEKIE